MSIDFRGAYLSMYGRKSSYFTWIEFDYIFSGLSFLFSQIWVVLFSLVMGVISAYEKSCIH